MVSLIAVRVMATLIVHNVRPSRRSLDQKTLQVPWHQRLAPPTPTLAADVSISHRPTRCSLAFIDITDTMWVGGWVGG